MDDTHDHLTDEQFDELLNGQQIKGGDAALSPAASAAQRHVVVCEHCRKTLSRLDELSHKFLSLKDLASIPAGDECPIEADLRGLVVSDLTGIRDEQLMRHVSNCDHCTVKLREAVQDFVLPPTSAEQHMLRTLQSSKPEWQARLAHKLAQAHLAEPSPIAVKITNLHARSFRWLLPAAALLLITFLFSGLYYALRNPSLDQLLASAYAERRTLELRIPGATYTPMPRERGPVGRQMPPSLLEAEIRIQRDSARHGKDARWLAGKGRAELLSHNPDAAIQSLKNALAITPVLVDARLDLASAYSERAAARDQPWDNAEAVEILTKILREQPRNQVAIFNFALILDRQNLFHQAAEQWHIYLSLDPTGGWADEARKNLERDENEIRNMSQQPGLLDGPEVAAAHLAASQTLDDVLDQRAEDYLRDATLHWLPLAYPLQSNPRLQTDYRSVLNILAAVLQRRHGDSWLSDLLNHSDSTSFPMGISLLAESVSATEAGDYAKGVQTARLAASKFAEGMNLAGSLRSRLEEVYSLRLSHNAAQCELIGAPLARELSNSRYAWATIQSTLELQECLNMQGELGQALSLSSATLEGSRHAHYPQLYLRSAFFAADTEASLGNVRGAWRRTHDALAVSWDSAVSPMRTYSLETELDLLADRTGRVRFDEIVLKEALSTLKLDPDNLMRAMANHRLAQAALAADDPDIAQEHFQKAIELFSAASQTPVTANHRMEAEVGLARVEILRNEFVAAARRLDNLQPAITQVSNRYLQIDFFQTLGEARLRLNRNLDADASLCSALRLTESALKTLNSDSDRLDWDNAAGKTYRTIVELKLQQQDIMGALEYWEWYRGSAIRKIQKNGLGIPNSLKALQGDISTACPLFELHAVRDHLPSLSASVFLSYAVLPSGIAAWAYDQNGVEFRWISRDLAAITHLLEHFAAQCADPNSDRESLRLLGRKLYDQLLAPLNEERARGRLIVIEPDGPLWSTPFSALVRRDGRYLSDFNAISEFPGIYYQSLLREQRSFDPSDAIVAISEDRATHFQDIDLPSLPSAAAEVRAITKQFPRTLVLENEEANFGALSKTLPQAAIFHFAGHAVQTPHGTALLIGSPPGESSSPSLLDATVLASMHFSNLQLAVLSACSTEEGAEGNGLLDSGSLVRTLMRGGVHDVIATGWPVESSASQEIMASFYMNLSHGASVPNALRLALAHTRTNESTSHPYYWAAFSLFGSSSL